MASSVDRTYSDALDCLNSLQSNFQTIQTFLNAGADRSHRAIPEMIDYSHRIGYQPADFDRLNIIHVAGTKGKGSTSAFVSSILNAYLPFSSQSTPSFRKVGLFTSPHLRTVRERIQINNAPLSESQFAQYFFETWDRLKDTKPSDRPTPQMPAYFRFLTLMAFHTYMREGVDTAIFECGIGGEYDSTNIVVRPRVTGITSLGIDHTALLGKTVDSIAWHKAGIMKPGIPCFSAPQPADAVAVLKQRAKEKGSPFTVVDNHDSLENVKLGLNGDFQRTNAALAVKLVHAHLSSLGHNLPSSPSLPEPFIRGLENVQLPGRCDVRSDTKAPVTWYIDSAHTAESLTLAAEWYISHLPHSPQPDDETRILLFNQQTRAPFPLLSALYHTILATYQKTPQSKRKIPFTHIVFCSNRTFASKDMSAELKNLMVDDKKADPLDVQKGCKAVWEELETSTGTSVENKKEQEENGRAVDARDSKAEIFIAPSIEEAIGKCREIARSSLLGSSKERGEAQSNEEDTRVKVLVTGSMHTVGGVLEVLETEGGAESVG